MESVSLMTCLINFYFFTFAVKLRKQEELLNQLIYCEDNYEEYLEDEDTDGMVNSIIEMSQMIRKSRCDDVVKKDASIKCQQLAEEAIKAIGDFEDSEEERISYQAMCLCEIALLYDDSQQTEAAIHTYDHAVSLMKAQLKKPEKFQVYGILLNNKGYLLERRALYQDALQCYNAALAAHKKAENFSSRAAKDISIRRNRANIRDVNRKVRYLSRNLSKNYHKFITVTPDYKRLVAATMFAACKVHVGNDALKDIKHPANIP